MARLSATVTEETMERLRALAAQYGIIARVGRYIGEPSVSGLLDAIGDGRLAIVPSDDYVAIFAKAASKTVDASVRVVKRTLLGPKDEDLPLEEWHARFDEELGLWAKAVDEAAQLMELLAERPRQARLPLGEESDAEATDEEE